MNQLENHTLDSLTQRSRKFAAARDWGQFHSPTNLSMALIAEAAELVEHFQWLTEEQSAQLPADKLEEVEEELADILVYLIRTADKLDIDLIQAAKRKIDINEKEYRAEWVRRSFKKHTD
jgi:dCTP diphosphatase